MPSFSRGLGRGPGPREALVILSSVVTLVLQTATQGILGTAGKQVITMSITGQKGVLEAAARKEWKTALGLLEWQLGAGHGASASPEEHPVLYVLNLARLGAPSSPLSGYGL